MGSSGRSIASKLVLYSNSRLGKGTMTFDSGLRQTVDANPGRPIQIFSEFLDEPEFGGDRYELTMELPAHGASENAA